jgi:GT2 family glycosyltransferase
MSDSLSISIILCSCNRASALRESLAGLGRVKSRPAWRVEVIVVDNASRDETPTVVRETRLDHMEVRYLLEPRRGKAHALNTGMGLARGDLLLFTDDDVLLAEDWLEEMVAALNNGCDAVTGRITLADHLQRPWLTPMNRWWLASSEDARPREGVRELIGASTGFRRAVLERVPAFDTELGPGALGLGEDTLFGWQLAQAGFKIEYAPKARAIHQPDASRLRHAAWLNEAGKHGRSEAYTQYHWEHDDASHIRLRWLWLWLKLHLRRIIERVPPPDAEGCPAWEADYVQQMAWLEQFSAERRRPRNYSRRGLVKRDSVSPTAGIIRK